jgi:hypothetical protein
VLEQRLAGVGRIGVVAVQSRDDAPVAAAGVQGRQRFSVRERAAVLPASLSAVSG